MTRVSYTFYPKDKWIVKKEENEENKERKKPCKHTETPIMIPLIQLKSFGWKKSNHTKKNNQGQPKWTALLV